jgi:uncharacterized membrane protein
MARNAWLDRHGRLAGDSIVREPAARLYFGVPNALLGLLYYPLVAAAFPFAANPAIRLALTAAVAGAALTSLVLMIDLTFVTRRDCANCWVAHAANLGLAVAVATRWN